MYRIQKKAAKSKSAKLCLIKFINYLKIDQPTLKAKGKNASYDIKMMYFIINYLN